MNKYQYKIYMSLSKLAVLMSPGKSKTKVLNDEETIKYLVDNPDKSLIRLGDGEFRILLKKRAVHYQDYSDVLRAEMMEFMNDYKSNNESEFLLCVPYSPFYEDKSWLLSHHPNYLQSFGLYRYYFRHFMNKNKIYGDAMAFAKGREPKYNLLWKNSEAVIFVHNDKKYADDFSQTYSIPTEFVQIPPSDSYEHIDEIQSKIEEIIESNKKKYTILISAGPCGKVLVYRLRKKGIVSYDTGHCWDEPLNI